MKSIKWAFSFISFAVIQKVVHGYESRAVRIADAELRVDTDSTHLDETETDIQENRHLKKSKPGSKNDDQVADESVDISGETATPFASPSHVPSLGVMKRSNEENTYYDSPTMTPTSLQNTSLPTLQATNSTSQIPTVEPTELPSLIPTLLPSAIPSIPPSTVPTENPSSFPSRLPTEIPSRSPSLSPTLLPSTFPSANSTGIDINSTDARAGYDSVNPAQTNSTIESPGHSKRVLNTRILVTTMSVEEREVMEQAMQIAARGKDGPIDLEEIAISSNFNNSYISALDVHRDMKGGKKLLQACILTMAEILEGRLTHNPVQDDNLDGADRRNLKSEKWTNVLLSFAPDDPDFAISDHFYWIQLDLPFKVSSSSGDEISARQLKKLQETSDQIIRESINGNYLITMLQAKDERIKDVSDVMIRQKVSIATSEQSDTTSAKKAFLSPMRLSGVLLMASITLVAIILIVMARKIRRHNGEGNAKDKIESQSNNLSNEQGLNQVLDKGRLPSSADTESYDPEEHWSEEKFTFSGGTSKVNEFRKALSEECEDIHPSMMDINEGDSSNPSILDFPVAGRSSIIAVKMEPPARKLR